LSRWTLEDCATAEEIYRRNQDRRPEDSFAAWKKAGLRIPAEYPGDWYVFRMVRRAVQRLKKKG
jgi:hypothetical protein